VFGGSEPPSPRIYDSHVDACKCRVRRATDLHREANPRRMVAEPHGVARLSTKHCDARATRRGAYHCKSSVGGARDGTAHPLRRAAYSHVPLHCERRSPKAAIRILTAVFGPLAPDNVWPSEKVQLDSCSAALPAHSADSRSEARLHLPQIGRTATSLVSHATRPSIASRHLAPRGITPHSSADRNQS